MVYDEFTSYYIYYDKEGMIDWFIENKTNDDKYVVLYRGGIIKGMGMDVNIMFHILGSEFAEVYFARGESSFVSSLYDLRYQALAVLDDGSNLQIGAVFYLPARSVIQIPELGYRGLYNINGEVLEVKCVGMDLYSIFMIILRSSITGLDTEMMYSRLMTPILLRLLSFRLNK
jgi:hypothetical protein